MIKEAKRELKEMMNLIDRMDNHYTIFEVEKLNEEVDELDARGRPNQFPNRKSKRGREAQNVQLVMFLRPTLTYRR